MPYYRWLGVTIEGQKKWGAQAALSQEALESILLNQNIAPMSIKKSRLILCSSPSEAIRAELYQQLLTLLRAGIRFPDALAIAAANYSSHPFLQEFLYHAASEMEHGFSLSSCVKKSTLFSPFEQNLFKIGEHGDHLIQTIEFTSNFLLQKSAYKEKLQAALMMPLIIAIITLSLFIGIIVFLIPQFAGFLQTSSQQLPQTIATLLAIRSFITNPLKIGSLIGGLACVLFLIKKISRIEKVDSYVSALKEHIPFYKTINTYSFLSSFFHTLYLMLASDHTIERSLSLIQASSSKQDKKMMVEDIFKKVQTGKPLSSVLKDYPSIFSLDDIFLMQAGELSGKSHKAAQTIYEKYSKKIDKIMNTVNNYAQPAAIIMLGLLIGSMVIGIYKPILSIALQI